MFLPDILHGRNDSHFFCIASVIRGHQKCRAARVILLMAGWPLCNKLITVARRFFGTMILSSMKTKPNLLERFLLCVWYSSGINYVVVAPDKPESSVESGQWLFRSSTVVNLLKNSFPFHERLAPDPSCFLPVPLLYGRVPF